MEPNKTNRPEFLASFSTAEQKMIAKNSSAYSGRYGNSRWSHQKTYTPEQIQHILSEGSQAEQRGLSRAFFSKDGYYRQIVLYYASLLKYYGILIPNPSQGTSLHTPYVLKKYNKALDFVDNMDLSVELEKITQKVLVDGCYFGIKVQQDKNTFAILDLPWDYCISRFKDVYGNDIVEFDLSYFDRFTDKNAKSLVRAAYPTDVIEAYDKYHAGKGDKWYFLPADVGIYFSFTDDARPILVEVIEAILDYKDSKDTAKKRDLEEIRKIIVQQIPHLNDGTLLFEPEEVSVMHEGTVDMLKDNDNISVMTTYGEVEAIVSKTSSDSPATTLKQMLSNIYSTAGVSSELFSSTGSSTLMQSVQADISLMMILGNKFSRFITNLINEFFSNSNIKFRFMILPVAEQTKKDFVDTTFKLAQSGYSFILPVIGLGISQRELSNLKDLEDVLKLADKLVPLASSYTQSGTGNGPGAPKKDPSEKAEQTIKNEKSLDNKTMGGSD